MPTQLSNGHRLPVCLATIHRLPGLLDGGQHGIVGNGGFSDHIRSLRLETHVEGLDTCVFEHTTKIKSVNMLSC